MNLDEVEKKLLDNPHPANLFGSDPDKIMREFKIATHPDRFATNPNESKRAQNLFHQILGLHEALKNNKRIKSKTREYLIIDRLAVGDVSDVYLAVADQKYILKCSRIKGGDQLLDHEQKFLTSLNSKTYSNKSGWYFERLVESFPVRDGFQKRVNVFEYDPKVISMVDWQKKYINEVGHIGWMFKRLLFALAVVQKEENVVHGAILPCHIMINSADHGIKLVGWGQSVKPGEVIKYKSKNYLDWYSEQIKNKKSVDVSSDIVMATNCMTWLFPVLPRKLSLFMKGCQYSLGSVNVLDLYEEYTAILKEVFEPKFITCKEKI